MCGDGWFPVLAFCFPPAFEASVLEEFRIKLRRDKSTGLLLSPCAKNGAIVTLETWKTTFLGSVSRKRTTTKSHLWGKQRLSYPFVEISINSGIPVNLSKPRYKNCRITVALRKMRTIVNPRLARVVTSVHLVSFDQFPVSKFLCC